MKRRGIIKGQTIEFDHPLGLPDGQAVELDIRPLEGENGHRRRVRPTGNGSARRCGRRTKSRIGWKSSGVASSISPSSTSGRTGTGDHLRH